MIFYFDASAAVKLAKPEPETPALRAFLRQASASTTVGGLVSSDLLRTELTGAVLQAGLPVAHGEEVLAGVVLFRMSPQICEAAGTLVGSMGLRSLDALHLATAVSLRARLSGILTYDRRFAEAAESLGMKIVSPS